MIHGARDPIGKKGQLRASAAGHFDLMHLHGIGKTRADEQLAPLRVPREDHGAAKVRVAPGLFHDRARNGRNALHDEILSRSQRGLNRARLRQAKLAV